MLQLIDGIYAGTATPASGGGGGGGGKPYKYNFETIGTPDVTGCVSDGFSSSNYLVSPELEVTGNPQKIHIHTRISKFSNESSFILVLFNESHRLGIATFGAAWKVCASEGNFNSIDTYSTNTWYDLDLVQEGETCTLYVNNSLVLNATKFVWFTDEKVKVAIGTSVVWESFDGFIDLSQTYISLDDTVIWKAAE